MKHSILTPLSVMLASIALSACAIDATHSNRAATPAQQQALAELEDDYNAGRYAEVARTVGLSVDLQSAPPSVQLPALKLQAFSYCLQDKTIQCERSFNRLLQRYPDFDLAPSERGHPMWGPVFAQAKVNSEKRAEDALADARNVVAPSR